MTSTARAGGGFLAGLQAGWRPVSGLRVLLAVSGGADSMALLDGSAELAQGLGLTLGVACVDHQLREGARAELETVKVEAERRGVPFFGLTVELAQGGNLEARARALRYDALEQLRRREGFALIATAHTIDDQAETVLMRLLRGSALRGSAAIRARTGTLVRPMLRCRRAEARAHVQTRGVPFFTDPMNVDPRFLRARVRQELLPALVALSGDAALEHLAHFAGLAADDEALLESLAAAAHSRLSTGRGLDGAGLRALEPAILRRVLRIELEGAGVTATASTLASAVTALEHGHAELVRGITASSAGGAFRLSRQDAAAIAPIAITTEGTPAGEWIIGVGAVPPEATWCAPAPEGELVCRSRQPGDRVETPAGHRKLQDVLVDAKVPRELRDRVPIVLGPAGEIVGVVGVWPRRCAPAGLYVWAMPIARRAGDGPGSAL
jgi:tRNA(Ile)-lysidine synthase